jgi:hypothetical protein
MRLKWGIKSALKGKKKIGLENALSRMRAQRHTDQEEMKNRDRARNRTTWRIEGPKAHSRKNIGLESALSERWGLECATSKRLGL